MKNLKLKSGRALVLVAHPDDETIWMGGTILNNPHIKWTIFCLCRGDDPDRAPKFRRAIKFLGARGIISDLEDEGKMNIAQSVPEIKRRIKKEIRQKDFTPLDPKSLNRHSENKKNISSKSNRGAILKSADLTGFTYIFTHGYNGEYGHPRHKAVHRALRELVDNGHLTTDNIFYFSYRLDEKKGIAVPNKKNAPMPKFSKSNFERKKYVIHKLYGFAKKSFEYRSCAEIETFTPLLECPAVK